MKPGLTAESIRFLAAGGLNTAATYILYLALLQIVGYPIAYSIAYAAGIALAYLLNTGFVFRVRRTFRRAALFPLVYVVQYVLGIVALAVIVTIGHIPAGLALLGVIVVTLPVNFLLSRLILKPSDQAVVPDSGDPQ